MSECLCFCMCEGWDRERDEEEERIDVEFLHKDRWFPCHCRKKNERHLFLLIFTLTIS